MEYFIVTDGVMWDSIKAVLKEKAAAGVEVRFAYDDLGSVGCLPKNFRKELAAAGAGVVLLPQIYAEKELSEGKLFVLPVAPPDNPAKTLYVSINPKSEKEKLVSAFLSIAGMNRSCGE